MPTSTFIVPNGTKLEIVYSNARTNSFTVDFQPDGGGPPQRLVSEIVEGASGDFIPFLLLTQSGTVKMAITGTTASGNPVPTATITLCASPHFMARFILNCAAGSPQAAEVQILVPSESK